VRENIKQLIKEKKEIEHDRLMSIAEKKDMDQKITSLERDIAMWARGKVFNFVPKISHMVELEFKDAVSVHPECDMKVQNFNSVKRMICDLCMQNSCLKKELSKVTTNLVKLMFDNST